MKKFLVLIAFLGVGFYASAQTSPAVKEKAPAKVTQKAGKGTSAKTCSAAKVKACAKAGKVCAKGKTCSKAGKACCKDAKSCSKKGKVCTKDAKSCQGKVDKCSGGKAKLRKARLRATEEG